MAFFTKRYHPPGTPPGTLIEARTPETSPLRIRLVDYRVRDLDSSDGTSARVRVLCEHANADDQWGTVGVHENIIDASWKALVEGLTIGLLRHRERNGETF